MFRHCVMFTFNDGTTPAQVKAVEEGLGSLPGAIDEIRAYVFGPDAGLVEGNFDFVVVADFDSADDYRTYSAHPVHQAFISETLRPILASRAAVQFAF